LHIHGGDVQNDLTVKKLLFMLLLLLLVAPVASGATSISRSRKGQGPAASAAASTAIAAAIQSRLTAAGYTIESLPMVVSTVGRSGVGVVHFVSPRRSPRGQLSFSIATDFASRHSFNLIISVHSSAADAAHQLTHIIIDCTAVHCHLTQLPYQGAERRAVVGSVLYDAVSNDGTSPVPTPEFNKPIALASGRATH
jgi:hypothetical protein